MSGVRFHEINRIHSTLDALMVLENELNSKCPVCKYVNETLQIMCLSPKGSNDCPVHARCVKYVESCKELQRAIMVLRSKLWELYGEVRDAKRES